MDREAQPQKRSCIGPALALAAAFAALGLSACGDGSGSRPPESPGASVYRVQGCGSCHRLSAAGSSGTAGPALDGRRVSAARVRQIVTDGGRGMISYRDRLSARELDALVRFVVNASR